MAKVYYTGIALTIRITDDGEKSIKALVDVHRDSITAQLARADMLARTLGDNGRLRSPDQFRKEGDGFWAIRAGTVRLYGWYESNGSFVISHAINKLHDKLAPADIKRMKKNQANYRSGH